MAGGVGAAVAGAALPVTAGLAGGAALGYGPPISSLKRDTRP